MANIITGPEILERVREICSTEGKVVLAVSYWGKGAVEAIGACDSKADIQIVLNVEHGGTNPEELKTLMTSFPERVRIHSKLHAKIYTAQSKAVVGSANASSPGLNIYEEGHAEAAVYLEDTTAQGAFDLAMQFYSAGEKATEEHVNICQRRFGRTTIAANETGGAEIWAEHPFRTFMRRQDIFGHMPFILSSGSVTKRKIEVAWEKQQSEAAELPQSEAFDISVWSYFEWSLDERYRGQVCVDMHENPNGTVSFYLVRPIYHRHDSGTFGRRLKWPEVGSLGKGWHSQGRHFEDCKPLQKAHENLHMQDFVDGWDVYREVGRPI